MLPLGCSTAMDVIVKALSFIFGFFAVLVLVSESKILRDIKLVKHECPGKPEYTILHVKAKKLNSNDTIHYLWTTIDYPTLVTAHTTNPFVSPDIKWNDCWNYNISFTPNVEAISAFVLTNVFEYNDTDDNQDATKNYIKDVLPIFSWKLKSCTNGTDGSPDAMFVAHSANLTKAKITLELKAFATDEYDETPPHEKVSESSSRFSLSLDNLPTTEKSSRYGLHIAFLKQAKFGAPTYDTSQSIDDEHTPGIFKLWKLHLPTKGGKLFASWKPVAYTKLSRSHDVQTFAHNFPKRKSGTLNKDATYPKTIMSSLIGNDIDAYTMTVSFGQAKDEWYRKTKFRSWTGLVGYGDPPESEISLKVYLILSIGLGLPVLFSLFGSMYLFIKRMKSGKKAAYEQIN